MPHLSQHLRWCLDCICEGTVSRNHYLHTEHLVDTNHLINIRFLGGKEFRCYLNSMTPEGQKRMSLLISFPHPSEKYLEILQVCNTWMLRVEFPLLASACQQHFAINLISDGHEEILLISVGDEIIGDTLSFYSKRVRAFMSYISFFFSNEL